ncbi:hypothetical protein GCM10022216_00220 [Sphingobacterium kyonggiense]|uniref:DUF4783 domain-containing protein n=1 Tax=Sphingobacterium kyonggiense TaxID=714075 RepID=A0ABP7Y5A5_9SPHI
MERAFRGISFKFFISFMAIAVLPLLSFAYWQNDPSNELMDAFKNNNAKGISAYFGQNVSLSIKNDSGHYSKFQAELMLSDFFRSNKTQDIKKVQQTNRNNSSFYIVYQLKSSSGTYRLFFKFNHIDGESQITELRIE